MESNELIRCCFFLHLLVKNLTFHLLKIKYSLIDESLCSTCEWKITKYEGANSIIQGELIKAILKLYSRRRENAVKVEPNFIGCASTPPVLTNKQYWIVIRLCNSNDWAFGWNFTTLLFFLKNKLLMQFLIIFFWILLLSKCYVDKNLINKISYEKKITLVDEIFMKIENKLVTFHKHF